MKTATTRFSLLFGSILLLSGCGATLQEYVREPLLVGTKTATRADRTGACFGLDRTGVPAAIAQADGEKLVGYENRFVRGADPFPCNHRYNYAHQTALLFDLNDLIARRALVTEATLEMDTHFYSQMDATELTRDCQVHFQRATAAWPPGDARGDASVLVSGVDVLSSAFDSSDGIARRDVLRAVQQWMNGRAPNHGLLLSPAPEHVNADETLFCVHGLRNFRLRLKVLEPAA